MNQKQQTNKRIGYIDALRGLIMVLVVIGHCALFNLGVNVSNDNNLHFYFHRFVLPLFFFVSGFLTYKKDFTWSLRNISGLISKKFFPLIIAPLIFFCIYAIFRDFPLSEFATPMKKGYWFTFALFNCILLYALLRKMLDVIRIKEGIALVILLIIGIPLYISPTIAMTIIGVPANVTYFLSIHMLSYFIFFVFGVFTKKHFEKVECLLDGSLMTCAIILFFALAIFVDTDFFKLKKLLLAISGIIIVFGYFKRNNDYFSGNSKLANVLRLVGQRTLDIYFIHYFFFSYNLPDIIPFFSKHNLPMIEIAVSLAMTIIVISASLVISSILRQSNTLAHYLFGEKKNN